MKRNDRLAFYESLLDTFLSRAKEKGYITFDVAGDGEEYVQYQMHSGRIFGEVGSRQWTEPERPLAAGAVDGLASLGFTGGGCAMTPREVYDRVGGFRQQRKQVFWLEDAAYIEDLRAIGYRAAILADLKVVHHGGPYYAQPTADKVAYWDRVQQVQARKDAVKRLLLRLPGLRPLNARFGWFEAPST